MANRINVTIAIIGTEEAMKPFYAAVQMKRFFNSLVPINKERVTIQDKHIMWGSDSDLIQPEIITKVDNEFIVKGAVYNSLPTKFAIKYTRDSGLLVRISFICDMDGINYGSMTYKNGKVTRSFSKIADDNSFISPEDERYNKTHTTVKPNSQLANFMKLYWIQYITI